jgi:hypothetical protein
VVVVVVVVVVVTGFESLQRHGYSRLDGP